MNSFTASLFETGFVSGAMRYYDHYPEDAPNVRMVLPVILGQKEPVEMIVDTGAQWCIIDPALVEILGLDYGENHTPAAKLIIREETFDGKLMRANIKIPAEKGDDLTVEATFFVPILQYGQTWNKPNFLGLDGFLNRIRFAVDPGENVFYFGPT